MPRYASNGGRYEVLASGRIARQFEQIQKRAKEEGRGKLVLSALRQILHKLTYDPLEFGEPLYRLPVLRLQIRHGFGGPVLIHFAVHQDRPLVFIKGVKLLPEPEAG